jgi:hypothetical protein
MTYQWVTVDSNKKISLPSPQVVFGSFRMRPMAQMQPSLLGVGWPERTGIWRTEVIARIPLFQKDLSTPTLGCPAADPSGQFLKKAFQIRAALDVGSRVWSFSLPLTR